MAGGSKKDHPMVTQIFSYKACLKSTVTVLETNIAPENGWLKCHSFLLGWPIFGGLC